LLFGICDLMAVNKGFLFPSRPGVLTDKIGIASVEETRNSRFFYYPSGKNLHPSSFHLSVRPRFETTLSLWFQNLVPNVGRFHELDYMQEIDALSRRAYSDFLDYAKRIDPQAQIRLLRAFNVGRVMSLRPLPIDGLSPLAEFPEYHSWLYKVEQPVPRAYMVNKSTIEKDPALTLQRLADSRFDPAAEVILDQEIPVRSRPSFVSETRILDYRNTLVRIETESNDEGILVFLDSYYPGWKAYIDGKESSIVKANHFYRAVGVPQGRHLVEFKYDPASFRIGLLISAATLFSVAVISTIIALHGRSKTALATLQ
jgi:hypothetical protein